MIASAAHIMHPQLTVQVYSRNAWGITRIFPEFIPDPMAKVGSHFLLKHDICRIIGLLVTTYFQPPESLGPITDIPYQPRIPASSECVQYKSEDLYSSAANFFPKTTTSTDSIITAAPAVNPSLSATAAGSSATNGALTHNFLAAWSEFNVFSPSKQVIVLGIVSFGVFLVVV